MGSSAREVARVCVWVCVVVCGCGCVSVVMDVLFGPDFNKKPNTKEPKMKNPKMFVTITLR